ncbi:paraquat-inducible protein A [Solimonas marina]|uniref:Paraquat-inducible membrane protein A n=1 Tax=Solimonas marina TaxID=2714601 RepID=A0A970B798_9GAMM|nr:paraquat-inducible protein A [Solimonas marina]NKF23663.1 paraquat-inducible membrane protein A [Solimonas marina]
MKYRTATEMGLLPCEACGMVCRETAYIEHPCCPRCDAPLHHRKFDSLRRSWAFLIAAAVLYIPANTLPIMRTKTLIYDLNSTIIGGIRVLWEDGSWDLALIVFVASICVPILKIVTLTILLISARRRSRWARRGRARLYRILEFVGQWSMLDVFVVALLVSLVDFGKVAEVHAGPGAIAFGAVVVLTMLASMSFDPRLIWDEFPDENPS